MTKQQWEGMIKSAVRANRPQLEAAIASGQTMMRAFRRRAGVRSGLPVIRLPRELYTALVGMIPLGHRVQDGDEAGEHVVIISQGEHIGILRPEEA